MKLSINARRAIKNYGEDVCAKAYMLTLNGENNAYARATEELGLKKNQVTPAINAGRELKAIEEERGFADTPLADIVAKFEDAPLYECEIPAAPACVTCSQDAQIVGRATRELPPGYFEGRLVSLEIDGEAVSCGFDVDGKVELREHQKAAVADVARGFLSRVVWVPLDNPGYRAKPHRPKTYKPYTLGIDSFKVIYSAHCNTLEDLRRLDDQDAKVCRIEQELLQYAGKRRTPHRDHKVAKLRKVLRILKRGLYE